MHKLQPANKYAPETSTTYSDIYGRIDKEDEKLLSSYDAETPKDMLKESAAMYAYRHSDDFKGYTKAVEEAAKKSSWRKKDKRRKKGRRRHSRKSPRRHHHGKRKSRKSKDQKRPEGKEAKKKDGEKMDSSDKKLSHKESSKPKTPLMSASQYTIAITDTSGADTPYSKLPKGSSSELEVSSPKGASYMYTTPTSSPSQVRKESTKDNPKDPITLAVSQDLTDTSSDLDDDDYDSDDDSLIKDWNREFQELLDTDDTLDKFERLSQLASDFAYAAQTYGKVIISELMIPFKKKTIKPVYSVGGIAGGEKYIVQGILFKFSLDLHNIYGGDEYSAKAAGAELRGMGSVFDCQIAGLRIPLMALIDYRGFRLVAVSILPIGHDTLVYGSSDGGSTVYQGEKATGLMKEIGIKLNLEEHIVEDKPIVGPGDIEVHEDQEDGEHYIVDTARMFPPQAPFLPPRRRQTIKGVHLWRYLRPEYVKRCPRPLSSDAFSHFQAKDPNAAEFNKNIQRATLTLFKKVIPVYAEKIQDAGENEAKLKRLLAMHQIHRAGINIRMIGRLRSCLPESCVRAREILLVEIISRVLKNLLREELRQKMRAVRIPSQEPYTTLVLDFFNKILGTRNAQVEESTRFWNVEIKPEIASRFPLGLSKEELQVSYDLFSAVRGPTLASVIQRLQKLTGIRLTKRANREMKENTDSFTIVQADVKDVPVVVKQLNIVYYALGNALMLRATSATTSPQEANRLWRLASDSFEKAVQASTDSPGTLIQWGRLLYRQSLLLNERPADSDSALRLAKAACEKVSTAIEIDPRNAKAHLIVACARGFWASFEQNNAVAQQILIEDAASHFCAALELEGGKLLMENHVQDAMEKQGLLLGILLRAAAVPSTAALQNFLKEMLGSMRLSALQIGATVTNAIVDDATLQLTACIADPSTVSIMDLTNNTLLTAEAGNIIAKNFTGLEVLNLSSCRNLEMPGVLSIVSGCSSLSTLVIPFIPGQDNEQVRESLQMLLSSGKVLLQDSKVVAREEQEIATREKKAGEVKNTLARSAAMFPAGMSPHPGGVIPQLAYDEELRDKLAGDILLPLVTPGALDSERKKQYLMALSEKPDAQLDNAMADSLVCFLKDPNEDMRAWCVMCLIRVGNPSCTRHMLDLLRSEEPDRFVREVLCMAMAKFRVSEATDLLIHIWRNDPISSVRQAAQVALQIIGGPHVREAFGSAASLRIQMDRLHDSMRKEEEKS